MEKIRYYLWGDDCLYAGHEDRDPSMRAPTMSTLQAPPADAEPGAYMRKGGAWISPQPPVQESDHMDPAPPIPADFDPLA